MSRQLTLSPAMLGVSAAVITLTAGAAGFGLAHLGKGPIATPAASNADRKVLYWYDPMVPAQHFDKPGKSPFMDMQLVPRYAGDTDPSQGGVRIDPARLQSLGMRLANVQRGDFAQDFTVAGQLDFNGRDVAIVQARANGFVQKVYARAPGDVVGAGAPIADILVPTWSAAQSEYLAVRRTGDASLEAAARQRLALLGMPQGLIDSVAKSGRVSNTITISTPVGGAIQTLDVRQGMTVNMGQTLAQVSGLSSVWLTAAVPETQAAHIKIGQPVTADLTAFPGEPVTGRVSAILPTAQADSRTLSVRVELPNSSGRLRPGMFATVHLNGESSSALFVPSEALIRTGKRTLVLLAGGKGGFTPVEVQAGRESDDRTEILAGLNEGDQIVASGQFLIDSEASLAGVNTRPLTAMSMPAPNSAAALYETRGLIEQLKGDSITLSHEPVPAIGWPAMTMTFRLKSANLARGMKTGDRVTFGFAQTADGPVIEKLQPMGGQ
ncbi:MULTISPECIES: efflux RND transporter periplasmic adaptor subunit [Asticcacaulis]|uniref:efflux RND transporter periplasmic adaptor subunit n=1 Tax=Asticcacaulis TaxID=76890 RepID=UPI001AE69CE2|nr:MULTISPECIES: efflux RND transporter periplasmic adaptor subunit [Asticcacaulis]MBP2159021.1 Cu(I)/Ag(I) efflux system membrane fusion protein [Asticcacaulis solisilvae]MDR6800066.1 Cu(I)/Ag(I) efflux system membrane fusion protein [Asticcacaulis sp. BE141]